MEYLSKKNQTIILWMTIAILGLIVLLFFFGIFRIIATDGIMRYAQASDFTAFYTAGDMFLHGEKNLYDSYIQWNYQKLFEPTLAPTQVNLFLNPPIFAALFALFALLPFTQAYLLWFVCNCCIILITAIFIAGMIPSKNMAIKLLSVLMVLTYGPTMINVSLAQVSFILALTLLLSWKLLRGQKQLLAGIVLSLLCIKPQYIVLPLLFFLWKKHWRVFFGLLGGTIFLAILSCFLISISGVHEYIDILNNTLHRPASTQIELPAMSTVLGFLLTVTHRSVSEIQPLWITSVIALLSLLWYISHKRVFLSSPDFGKQWACLIIGIIITSTYTNFQDLSILIVSATAFLVWAYGEKNRFFYHITILYVCIGYVLSLFSNWIFIHAHLHVYLPYLVVPVIFFSIEHYMYMRKIRQPVSVNDER